MANENFQRERIQNLILNPKSDAQIVHTDEYQQANN